MSLSNISYSSIKPVKVVEESFMEFQVTDTNRRIAKGVKIAFEAIAVAFGTAALASGITLSFVATPLTGFLVGFGLTGLAATAYIISQIAGNILLQIESAIEKEKNDLDKIMDTPILHKLFEEHCNNERSIENFNAYIDLKEFKNLISEGKAEKIKEKCSELVEKGYFVKDSKNELNIDDKQKDVWIGIKNKVEQNEKLNDEEKQALSDLIAKVTLNLSDSYSRFILTDVYKQYPQYKEHAKLIRTGFTVNNFLFGTILKQTPCSMTEFITRLNDRFHFYKLKAQ